MKVVFISNYFNHHQKAFSEAMDKLTEHNYHFIATSVMGEFRKKLGYEIMCPDYVLQNFISPTVAEHCQKLIDEADVVIIGSAPDSLIKNRLKKKQLVFYYSERLYKKKCKWYKLPLRIIRHYLRFGRHKNVYLLCASAYTAADYAKTFSFLNKTYKWGYFPEVKQYEDIDKLIGNKQKNSLLWVARLIDLKHPEMPVKVVKRLRDNGYDVHLSMIGNGPLEEGLKDFIKRLNLEDYVDVLGAMSPEQVREYMEKSEIFLFTSDRNEGWGAVLNEAMNSGCAVVASHAIGSAPFLINDKENALIYKDGDLDDLYEKVKWLMDNPEQCAIMGKKAYQTMIEQWNAENAAKRVLLLAEKLIGGQKKADIYNDGVCSKASILKDNWYKG